MILEKLAEFGFTKEQINTILTDYSVRKMGKKKMLKTVSDMLDYLKKYGYSDDDIIKMSKLHPQIYEYSANNISQKILFLQNLGYINVEIIKMTRNCPQIFSISVDNILDKISILEKFGYKMSQILHMVSRFPQLLTLSNEYIINKNNNLMALGYTQEEVNNIVIKLPQLWSMTMENITAKKEFYDALGVSDFILVKANLLMQSIDLSYARYMFYKSRGKNIDSSNYMELFCDQNRFKLKYHKSNKELVEEYPYDKGLFKERIKK